MVKVIDWMICNKEWLFSGVGIVAVTGLLRFVISRIMMKEPSQGTDSSIYTTGKGNIVGNGNIGGDSIQGDYIAEQKVFILNHEDEKKQEDESWFSVRFKTFQELLNTTRVFSEKEYTTEYISSLLGLSNVCELKRYLDSSEEPDDSFKRKYVEVFGVNEEWIMFNRGEYPFASNQNFSSDDPMDILRNQSLNNIEDFVLIIGELEGKKYALIVEKYSDVHYEVIPKTFIFYPQVGAHGESMLVSLYRFIRETARVKKLFASVYLANEKEFADILSGGVPAKKALLLPVIRDFESILLDLNDEEYDRKHLDSDFIQIKEIIRGRLEEIDKINQAVDREKIYKNLGKEDHSENDIASFDKSAPFFAYRFAKAFPGVRGMKVFDNPKEAADRLELLLKHPLSSPELSGPIWWFRGSSNLHISKFTRVGDDKFLMDSDEIKIRRIIAYSATSYYKNFVYVETVPEPQTGLYTVLSTEELKKRAEEYQIFTEEYAVVGDKIITRAEYDDGAALIDGKPVDVAGKAKLRVRYLMPYNFLICAHFNPINDTRYDSTMKDLMDKLLTNDIEFNVLSELVEKMPRHRRDL